MFHSSNLISPPPSAGAIADWPALKLWKGTSGLQHLVDLAGSASVQVMISPATNSSFVGDMEHLQLLHTTLASFLNGSLSQSPHAAPAAFTHTSSFTSSWRFYLAQCPISARDSSANSLVPGPLHALLQDIHVPHLLSSISLSQINLWANMSHPARSSLHYDPYCNLLCLVTGSKTIRLLPPSATCFLPARPAYHDSANHAEADLWGPGNESLRDLDPIEISLDPGNVLFIPEGWWHQVESSAGTMAVNFWWESAVEARFGGVYDGYYLRRLAQSLGERERHAALAAACSTAAEVERKLFKGEWTGDKEALVVESLAERAMAENNSRERSFKNLSNGVDNKTSGAESSPSAELLVLALLEQGAAPFMRALAAFKTRYPSATAEFLLHQATPVVWEALTCGLERAVAATGNILQISCSVDDPEEALGSFYDHLYSCVSDRKELTAVMLRAKETFSKEAMIKAVANELGVDFL